MKTFFHRIIFPAQHKRLASLAAENADIKKKNEAIMKFINETCIEWKRKYNTNFGVLTLIQEAEASITWVNPHLRNKH